MKIPPFTLFHPIDEHLMFSYTLIKSKLCANIKTLKNKGFIDDLSKKMMQKCIFQKTLLKNNVFLQEQCYNVTKEKHCTYGDRSIRGEENGI